MTAVVTGGRSGIGRAVADRLRAGGEVWDINGGDIDCGISDVDSVSAAIGCTVADHGAPDRLVACAGIGSSGLLLDQKPGDWQRLIDTDLTGTWLTMRAVAQAMVDHGSGGSIVAVSSISGTLADATWAPTACPRRASTCSSGSRRRNGAGTAFASTPSAPG